MYLITTSISQQDLLINNSTSNVKRARCKLDLSDYLDPLYLIKFSPILKSLKTDDITSLKSTLLKYHQLKFKHGSERVLLNERILSTIVYHYKKYMEMFFGKNSPKPRELTKFPSSIFRDFSVYGSLHFFLVELLNLVVLPNGINSFENIFSKTSKSLNESLKSIEQLLIQVIK